jgi:hypothetical protein
MSLCFLAGEKGAAWWKAIGTLQRAGTVYNRLMPRGSIVVIKAAGN